MNLTISEIYRMVADNLGYGDTTYNDNVIINHDLNIVSMKFYDGDKMVCTMYIERTIHGLGEPYTYTATIEGDSTFITLETIKSGL